jgi:hypothetical protein
MTSRLPNEQVFGAALSNEYQWRNLYLKEFGCCTYAPPIPKDPTTTVDGTYPLWRQVAQLNPTFSESDVDEEPEANNDQRTSLSFMTPDTSGHDMSFRSVSPMGSSSAHPRSTTGEQFFLLDLSSHHNSLAQQQQQRSPSKSVNSGRRTNRGAALRKDDFFDVNDAFSTKLFSFLWRHDDDDDDGLGAEEEEEDGVDRETSDSSVAGNSSAHRTVTNDNLSSAPFPSRQRRLQQQRQQQPHPQRRILDSIVHDPHNSGAAHRLNFSRNTPFSSLSHIELNDNPRGVHQAMLQLHHETWTMLMDNRLMAWLHRQTADHYQSATQLRQHLLDVVARGPSIITGSSSVAEAQRGGAGGCLSNARSAPSPYGSTCTQEEALQSTLDSFSPFFAVIAPAAAVQRARDQCNAARRAQLRGGSRAAKVAPADIVGLPLYSQYGSWREAYEHRQRWSKAPFSFFLLHDSSFNYAQVTAIFVELHLLYIHAHSHTRLCAEVKPESVALYDTRQLLTNSRNITRAAEFQRSMCPLTAMQEVTENVVLAYEQSPSRATLTMLRRVLDFLTDTALDVVTAHRFLSREALLRQSGFDLPGMERRAASCAPTGSSASTAAATHAVGKRDTDAADTNTDSGQQSDGNPTATSEKTGNDKAVQEEDEGERQSVSPSTVPPATVQGPFLEPQRVTEKEFNDLFELAYWFVDTATANAGVPVDRDLIHPPVDFDVFVDPAASSATAPDGPNTYHRASVSPFSLSPTAFLQDADTATHSSTARYLPGKEMLFSPVESFVEAVELFEAQRKPLWMQQVSNPRGMMVAQQQQKNNNNKKVAVVAFSQDDLPRSSFMATVTTSTSTAAAAAPSPMLSADSFTGLATPLVLLTTYLRLHGGQWLKQLCHQVFDTLRKESVLLYVNTVDLDAMWSRLQDSSSAASAPEQGGSTATTPTTAKAAASITPVSRRGRGGRGSTRGPSHSFSTAAAPVQSASAEAPPDVEVVRHSFIEGMGRFEAVISQDILYAVTEFFKALHGRHSAGRLPRGISVLLTQFVTTVHLFLLEAGGVFGTSDAAPGGSPGSPSLSVGGGGVAGGKRPASQPSSRAAALDTSPVRQVEERLQVCKQRYYAGLRRRQVDSTEAFLAATANTAAASLGGGRISGNRQAQEKSLRASPAAAATASLKRLIQTIEHHRLAKFVLFDCWILPALNNATSLGYLAPDSSLHLRWNVDALARYLKILLHAPFAEQDRATFASLAGQGTQNVGGNKPSDRSTGGAAGKHGKSGGSSWRAPPRQKSNKAADNRVQPTNVLTLPSYVTGIYDVATGSLVRLLAAASPHDTPAAAETSMRSLSRRSVAAGRGPKLTATTSLLTPETLSLPGNGSGGGSSDTAQEQPSFVLSGGGANEISRLDNPSAGRSQSKPSLFESLPAAEALEAAPRDPLSSSAVGGKGKKPAASAAQRSISGSTAEPMLRSDPTFSPTEKQFLPPVITVHGASEHKSSSSSGGRAQEVVSVLKPTQPTPSSSGVEASRSSVLRPLPHWRQQQRQLRASSAFNGLNGMDSAPSQCSPTTTSAVGGVGTESYTHSSVQHPYVFVSNAGWLDMSPAMQLLNEQLGLVSSDPDAEEDVESGGLIFPKLPTAEVRHSCGGPELSAAARTGATSAAAMAAAGMRLPSMDDTSFVSYAAQRATMEDTSAVQALDIFCKAADSDESDNAVVSEFDVLPTMAAGCIERLYDVVTGTHPTVARALQMGVFNFTRQSGRGFSTAAAAGFSSLYSACLNGVLLHPRTASHVIRNIFDNSPALGQALMQPVAEGTALELLSGLVARQGETPMVDANSIVPLLQMSNPISGRGNDDTANGGGCLSLLSGENTTTNAGTLARRWEMESRRLLRQFTFLTSGFADTQRPLPLVPGMRRHVGPVHPIHMIRAGAARIAADADIAGAVPIVFDPWWRAMVVALSVKAANMFDECRDEHAAAFLKMVHDSEEASKHLCRHAMAHFVATKGKETVGSTSESNDVKRRPTTAVRHTRGGAAAAAAAAGSSLRGRDSRRRKGSGSSTAHTRRKPAPKRSLQLITATSTTSATGG